MRDPYRRHDPTRRAVGVLVFAAGLIGAAVLVADRPAVPTTPIICCVRETTR